MVLRLRDLPGLSDTAAVAFRDTGFVLERGASLEELDMGHGSVLALRITGAETDGRVTVVEGIVHEGGPPRHVHEDEDEIVVVLEGEVAYELGDDHGVVGAGALLWFPRHVPHAIAQHGVPPCRFLTIATPAGIEELFRAQHEYLSSLDGAPPDPAALATVRGADRRPVVGPPIGG